MFVHIVLRSGSSRCNINSKGFGDMGLSRLQLVLLRLLGNGFGFYLDPNFDLIFVLVYLRLLRGLIMRNLGYVFMVLFGFVGHILIDGNVLCMLDGFFVFDILFLVLDMWCGILVA